MTFPYLEIIVLSHGEVWKPRSKAYSGALDCDYQIRSVIKGDPETTHGLEMQFVMPYKASYRSLMKSPLIVV
jgi:hypothetical protein